MHQQTTGTLEIQTIQPLPCVILAGSTSFLPLIRVFNSEHISAKTQEVHLKEIAMTCLVS